MFEARGAKNLGQGMPWQNGGAPTADVSAARERSAAAARSTAGAALTAVSAINKHRPRIIAEVINLVEVAMAKKDDGKKKKAARGPGSAPMYMETIEQRKASKAFRKGGADDGGRVGGGGGGGGDDGDDGGWNSGDGDGEVRHSGFPGMQAPCESLGGS